MAAEIEVWSNWAGAGGRAYGCVSAVASATMSEAIDNSDECEVVLNDDEAPGLARGFVLRITDTLGRVREYRINRRASKLRAKSWNVKGLSPWVDLSTVGPITQTVGGLQNVDIGGSLTVTDWITTVILPFLASKGITWLSLGTVTPTQVIQIDPNKSGYSPSSLLLALGDRTGCEVRLRRNGESGYYIDVVTQVGSSAPRIIVSSIRNLVELSSNEDDEGLVSGIMGLGDTSASTGQRATIGENAWAIGTATGSGPYWVPLTDPDGGDPPIKFDGQFGNSGQDAYLLLKDATTVQITDSRKSDSAVEVSSLTGITAGDLCQFVQDASATRLIELTNPSVWPPNSKTADLNGNKGERNLARNGLFTGWTTDVATPHWAMVGGMKMGRYPRATILDPGTVMVINGNQSAGVSAINLKGGTPGDRFYYGEAFKVNAGTEAFIVLDDVAVCDGSGHVTITLGNVSTFAAATLASGVTDGAATSGWFYVTPKRPGAFPIETTPYDVARFLRSDVGRTEYAKCDTFKVKYVSGLARVYAAAGWTVVPDSGTINTASYLPSIDLRNIDSGTSLGSADLTSILPLVAGATYHTTLACSGLLSVDTTVQLRLNPGGIYTTLNYRNWTGCRWATMWIGPSEVPSPLGDSPNGNRIWQKVNRELVARALSWQSISLSMKELSSLVGYSVTDEMVVLGGYLDIEDAGISVRVVAVSFNPFNPQETRVTLDSRPVLLTRYLAERT